MRTRDADILIVPGWTGSGPDHWQSRWEAKLPNAARVKQRDWDAPDPEEWAASLVDAVERTKRPAVLVAHSCGVLTVARAAPALPPGRVAGAFLVATPDPEDALKAPSEVLGFAPTPRERLPFPSLLVASHDDPYCDFAVARELAQAWGARFVDAGSAGHLNTASGHGPWPEGLMTFAGFLNRLTPANGAAAKPGDA